MGDVVFIESNGGLGRSLPGQDYISGLVFYTGTLPSGFSSSDRIKQIFSIEQAESLGILDDFSDETLATGTVTLTNVGALSDTVVIKVVEPNQTVTLASYSRLSTDTTVTLLAASIVAAINLYTYLHGYSATNTAGVITLTARKGLGVYLNAATKLTFTKTGTIAGSVSADFSGGVASKLAVYHYHIAEYFRIQPQGNLYLGFFAVPSPYVFTELQTLQIFANGDIREAAVYKDGAAFSTADIQAIQAIDNILFTNKMKIESILYAADLVSVTDLATLATLASLNSKNVSAIIGQDGYSVNATPVVDGIFTKTSTSGLGYELFCAYGKSITCVGASLGAVSLAAVNEDISWVQKFNLSNGTELATPAFANGNLYKNIAAGLLTQIDVYRYIYLRKFIGDAGTYHQDSHTAVLQSSDYAFIENNRVIGKAERLLYKAFLPFKSSPLPLNADGTMQDATVATLESTGDNALADMLRNTELSANATIVDPAQNVTSTSKVSIQEKLLGVPNAKNIEITIGFVLEL